jgi:hypothetical protein
VDWRQVLHLRAAQQMAAGENTIRLPDFKIDIAVKAVREGMAGNQ